MKINPKAKLDPTQVEDRRSPTAPPSSYSVISERARSVPKKPKLSKTPTTNDERRKVAITKILGSR